MQHKKSNKLFKSNVSVQDPSKVIFNFLSVKKEVLRKV